MNSDDDLTRFDCIKTKNGADLFSIFLKMYFMKMRFVSDY